MNKELFYAEILKNGFTVRKVVGKGLNNLSLIVDKYREYFAFSNIDVIKHYKITEKESFPRKITLE